MASLNDDDILQVTIHHCDNLKSNILLLQPVLCMHVIDVNSGSYLKKSNRSRAVVSFYENQRNDVDYIMPVMTQPCSVSREKLTSLHWEEVFLLNESYNVLLDKASSIILCFEIIDLTPISQTKYHYERLDQSGKRKIAWAFLKLLGGNNVINIGSKLRLQLFKPFQPAKKKGCIEVYEWWLKKNRTPLEASLFISIKPLTPFSADAALRSLLPFQQEKGSTTFEKLTLSETGTSLHTNEQSRSTVVDSQETAVIWSRKNGEPCKIPTVKALVLDIFSSCQILKFSTNGRILAAACGSHECYYIMFFQIPSGRLLHKTLAHSEFIYDFDWSYNDKYLLSASGDYSVKLWNTKVWILKETFVHPSYVYSSKFHPKLENLFASSCYDHTIRIWSIDKCQLLNELEAHTSTVCTICWNKSGTHLFSADGIGQIKIWKKYQGDFYQLENEINPKETKGVSINKMLLDPQEESLCLFCSDSVARIVSLDNGQILSSYQSDCSSPKLSKGCCSPCGSLLFLCCDKGNVSVWNISSCNKSEPEVISVLKYGILSSIDYHPFEHMFAASVWEEGVPIHLFAYEESAKQEVKDVTSVFDEKEMFSNECANCKNKQITLPPKKSEQNIEVKKRSKHEKMPTKGAYFEAAAHSALRKHGPAKYKTEEVSSAGSTDMYGGSLQKKCMKESLTAVITKSGQFDVIAVPDDSASSDTNTFRSLSNNPVAFKNSSKRSLRRKKLKEMQQHLL